MINVAHIDGDILVFRAAFACEKAVYELHVEGQPPMRFEAAKDLDYFVKANKITTYVRDKQREIEPVEYVYANLRSMLDMINDNLNPDYTAIYLTGTDNFRRRITPTYKANRDKSYRPHWFEEARIYLQQQHQALVVNGYEADDAIGLNYQPGHTIVSIDKDLKTIPGDHYNFVKNEAESVSADQADLNFWRQMLMGDVSDNVIAVKGIGPKTAEKLIRADMRVIERMAEVFKQYKKHNLDFEQNYYLLRILRSEDEYRTVQAWISKRQVSKT